MISCRQISEAPEAIADALSRLSHLARQGAKPSVAAVSAGCMRSMT